YGETTVEDLEKAGAFERLKVEPEANRNDVEHGPFWEKREIIDVIISAILLAISYGLSSADGEDSFISIFGFATGIIIGGYSLFWKGL
ncbi:cation-transporting P-type ATPase, partial [Bacillus paranthracis]|nr:cation-transporting P-type ATPase [Bacillus paranthracis]